MENNSPLQQIRKEQLKIIQKASIDIDKKQKDLVNKKKEYEQKKEEQKKKINELKQKLADEQEEHKSLASEEAKEREKIEKAAKVAIESQEKKIADLQNKIKEIEIEEDKEQKKIKDNKAIEEEIKKDNDIKKLEDEIEEIKKKANEEKEKIKDNKATEEEIKKDDGIKNLEKELSKLDKAKKEEQKKKITSNDNPEVQKLEEEIKDLENKLNSYEDIQCINIENSVLGVKDLPTISEKEFKVKFKDGKIDKKALLKEGEIQALTKGSIIKTKDYYFFKFWTIDAAYNDAKNAAKKIIKDCNGTIINKDHPPQSIVVIKKDNLKAKKISQIPFSEEESKAKTIKQILIAIKAIYKDRREEIEKEKTEKQNVVDNKKLEIEQKNAKKNQEIDNNIKQIEAEIKKKQNEFHKKSAEIKKQIEKNNQDISDNVEKMKKVVADKQKKITKKQAEIKKEIKKHNDDIKQKQQVLSNKKKDCSDAIDKLKKDLDNQKAQAQNAVKNNQNNFAKKKNDLENNIESIQSEIQKANDEINENEKALQQYEEGAINDAKNITTKAAEKVAYIEQQKVPPEFAQRYGNDFEMIAKFSKNKNFNIQQNQQEINNLGAIRNAWKGKHNNICQATDFSQLEAVIKEVSQAEQNIDNCVKGLKASIITFVRQEYKNRQNNIKQVKANVEILTKIAQQENFFDNVAIDLSLYDVYDKKIQDIKEDNLSDYTSFIAVLDKTIEDDNKEIDVLFSEYINNLSKTCQKNIKELKNSVKAKETLHNFILSKINNQTIQVGKNFDYINILKPSQNSCSAHNVDIADIEKSYSDLIKDKVVKGHQKVINFQKLIKRCEDKQQDIKKTEENNAWKQILNNALENLNIDNILVKEQNFQCYDIQKQKQKIIDVLKKEQENIKAQMNSLSTELINNNGTTKAYKKQLQEYNKIKQATRDLSTKVDKYMELLQQKDTYLPKVFLLLEIINSKENVIKLDDVERKKCSNKCNEIINDILNYKFTGEDISKYEEQVQEFINKVVNQINKTTIQVRKSKYGQIKKIIKEEKAGWELMPQKEYLDKLQELKKCLQGFKYDDHINQPILHLRINNEINNEEGKKFGKTEFECQNGLYKAASLIEKLRVSKSKYDLDNFALRMKTIAKKVREEINYNSDNKEQESLVYGKEKDAKIKKESIAKTINEEKIDDEIENIRACKKQEDINKNKKELQKKILSAGEQIIGKKVDVITEQEKKIIKQINKSDKNGVGRKNNGKNNATENDNPLNRMDLLIKELENIKDIDVSNELEKCKNKRKELQTTYEQYKTKKANIQNYTKDYDDIMNDDEAEDYCNEYDKKMKAIRELEEIAFNLFSKFQELESFLLKQHRALFEKKVKKEQPTDDDQCEKEEEETEFPKDFKKKKATKENNKDDRSPEEKEEQERWRKRIVSSIERAGIDTGSLFKIVTPEINLENKMRNKKQQETYYIWNKKTFAQKIVLLFVAIFTFGTLYEKVEKYFKDKNSSKINDELKKYISNKLALISIKEVNEEEINKIASDKKNKILISDNDKKIVRSLSNIENNLSILKIRNKQRLQ